MNTINIFIEKNLRRTYGQKFKKGLKTLALR